MSHSSQIVKIEKLAPGLIAVHVRCCGDPTTQSSLSVGIVAPDTGKPRSQAEIDADILKHHQQVEATHEADLQAGKHIERLMREGISSIPDATGDCGCAK